uniref:Uncharacterized protein n=1 Tax=Rangifer tarandus platyrhynchus TaxID=3082113 RepID=A0ACB0EEE2_RANTA|nr:unnamed protein product [Rangifer tarandus platyrhynchus]
MPRSGISPRSPHAPRGEGEGSGGDPKGPATWNQNVPGEKGKSFARLVEKKFFGGGVFCTGPDAGSRRGFPSPSLGLGLGPLAGDARREERGCRLRGCPRGEDRSHLWVTLSRPESPCPGDAKTLAAGSARTRLPLKDIS